MLTNNIDKIMKKFLLFIALLQLSFIGFLQAQTTEKEFFSDSRYAGGLHCPYIYTASKQTPAPAGYTPFYISHYGRHGSRWTIPTKYHTLPNEILEKALKAGKLTELGKSVCERMNIIAADAAEHYGDLSSLGAKEHKGIAERMFKSFPEVFSTDNGRRCYIFSRSTQVPRCILSMAAFNERLKELNPAIEITREATKKDHYLNNGANINTDTVNTIVTNFIKKHFNPERFISSIFNDKSYADENVKDQETLAYYIFMAGINMPNLEQMKISLMDVFTRDEIFTFWQASSMEMYFYVGPSPINGKNALKSASLLLKNILDCADSAIKNKNISADLRFGHDSYIVPLLALMDIKNMNVPESDPDKVYKVWCDFKASPMGTNVQLIFYKNNKNDDILVKVLHCEKEVEIPVKTDIAPYYHWKDLRAYYQEKISR